MPILNIIFSLHFPFRTEKHRTKPILKCDYPRNTSVLLGQNASLTCVVVISGTLPDFRWLKWSAVPKMYPGALNFQNGSYSLVNPRQYETVYVAGKYGVKVNIRNVTSKELGLYTCYVSNHLGYDYRSAFLSPRNKLWRGSLSGKITQLNLIDFLFFPAFYLRKPKYYQVPVYALGLSFYLLLCWRITFQRIGLTLWIEKATDCCIPLLILSYRLLTTKG